MCTQHTVNTDEDITDDLLLCIRNDGQLSFSVPDHELNQKPSFIFHISYIIFIYLPCCGLLFTWICNHSTPGSCVAQIPKTHTYTNLLCYAPVAFLKKWP